MWPYESLQDDGDFQRDRASFPHSYSDDGYIPFSPAPFGQQYFQNLRPSSGMIPNNDPDNSEQFTSGEFQPEVGLYNEEDVTHSQFRGSNGPEDYVTQRHGIAPQGVPRPTLNARAEELKAQLLKSKERAKSGTPPVSTANSGPKSSVTTDASKSFRESSQISVPSSDEPPGLSRRSSAVMDDDLDDLILQAQAAAKGKKERTESIPTPTKSQHSSMLESTIKSQIHNVESSAKMSTPGTNGTSRHAKLGRHNQNKNENNGDLSDVSEGEIQEDTRTKNKFPQAPNGSKESHSTARPYKQGEQPLRRQEEPSRKTTNSHETRGTSPYRDVSVPKSRVIASRLLGDKHHDEAEERFERRSRQSSETYERKHQPEPDQRSYVRRDIRDVPKEYRKHETKNDGSKGDIPSRKLEVPTLAQILLVDEDLKDWLDVTGYHNADYRNKILNRRRAIAALDAQKAKLLEEMEIEERGGVPPAANTQVSGVAMLPPPIPSKMGAAASSGKKIDDTPARTDGERFSSTIASQDSGTKRTYTDYRGSQDEGYDGLKVGRAEGRGMGIRIKADTQTETHRPKSSGPDASSRHSIVDDNKTYRQEETDSYDEDRSRDRGRGYDRQLNGSSPDETFDRSPLAKLRKYESYSSEEHDDRSDWRNRPFVMRGNYRGRAYDPNFRGRGRGRGSWNELGEGRFERRDSQPSQPHAQRLAFMKPYKDIKPLDLGRKGDTKYFIVKSFNEENVVRCIEDSIWTTQVENGEIFKAAFLKYKNVVLVFSVNQSRAFQGYARMESIPGSEEAPHWQNNINWESAGAFRVRWLCVANTRFHRVGHIKNRHNENQPVLVGRDGQEIEEVAGEELIRLIDEEAEHLLNRNSKDPFSMPRDD